MGDVTDIVPMAGTVGQRGEGGGGRSRQACERKADDDPGSGV